MQVYLGFERKLDAYAMNLRLLLESQILCNQIDVSTRTTIFMKYKLDLYTKCKPLYNIIEVFTHRVNRFAIRLRCSHEK